METYTLSRNDAVEVIEGVYLTQLAAGERMSVLHYHIEPGAAIPEHSHEHEQAGFAYRGTGTFTVNGEELVVGPSESYSIPSGEPHAVENLGDDALVGVDVFSPPRLDVTWTS